MRRRLSFSRKNGVENTLFKSLKSSLFTLSASLLGTFQLTAQLQNYQFSQINGVYTEITNGTVIAEATASTSFDSENWSNIAIPFSFPFNGSEYTSLNINSNGYITFGTIIPDRTLTSPLTSTVAYSGAISAFARDLSANTSETHLGKISSLLTHNGADQIFTIEFKNWEVFTANNSNYPNINFQIQLFSTGEIRIVYGQVSAIGTYTSANTVQVGLRGASTADYSNRVNPTSQSFSASTAGTSNTALQNYSFAANAVSGLPTNGLTYIWAIAPNSCFTSGAITTSNITSTGVSFDVTTNTGSFDYEIRTSGAAGSGNTGLVQSGQNQTSTVNITGLQANTSYTIYARTNCNGTPSIWSSITNTFRTACINETLPYFEGFNESTLSLCWSTQVLNSATTTNLLTYPTSGTSPTTAVYEGARFLRFNSGNTSSNGHIQRVKSTTLDATGTQDIAVEFNFYQMNLNSNEDRVVLNYSIDNGTTWNIVDSVMRYDNTLAANQWVKKQLILPAAADNAPNLQIALDFKSAAGQAMSLDSFYVRAVPSPIVDSHDDLVACASINNPTAITLTGKNLHRAIVTVGGNPVTILNQSGTEITIELPANTEGEVRIVAPNGTAILEDFAFIYLAPTITTREIDTRVCVNTPVTINITSPLTDFDSYTTSFQNNGTITGTAADGYQISAPNAQDFIITGVKEINGFTCNLSHTVLYDAIPGPGIVRQFEEITTCEGEILNLSFYESAEPIGNTGPNGGTATTSTGSPHFVVNNYGGTRNQTIYTAEELTAMGWSTDTYFSAISFETTAVTENTRDSLKVRIGHTTQSVATTTFINEGLVEKMAPSQWTPQIGVNTFTFSTPFIWDGTSNIVIDIAHSSNSTGNGVGSISIIREAVTTTLVVNKNTDNITAAAIYDTPTGSVNTSQRTKFTLYSSNPTPTAATNTIEWTSNQNLYLNNIADRVFNNENTSEIWYKTTAENDVVQLRVRNNIGCVSEASYVINSIPTIRENIFEEACNFFVHRGNYLTQSGIYIDTFTSRVTGCDSLYILNLTIDNPTVYTPSIISCGSYDLNGRILTTSGNYSSTFTNVNGCDSIVQVNLTIIDRIIPQIYSIGDTLYATSNVPNALYQWRNCTTGMIIPGANGSSFHPQEHGTYNVLVAEGTCNGASVCAVYGSLGIEILENMDFNVSPNPTTGMVTITYDSEEQMDATIMDASGKEIGTTSIYSGSKIDLSSLVPGIYLIKIESSTSNQVVRVVKQ